MGSGGREWSRVLELLFTIYLQPRNHSYFIQVSGQKHILGKENNIVIVKKCQSITTLVLSIILVTVRS